MKRLKSHCIAPFVVAVVPVALAVAVYSGSDNGSNGSGGGSSSSRSSSSSSSGRRFVSAHCAASLHGRLRAMLRFRHSFQRVAL